MPELPEVEITRQNLQRWLRGQRIVRAEAERTRTFRGAKPEDFDAIRGEVRDVSRKGKYLLLSLDNGQGLLMHLGMTGKFVRRKTGEREPYSRARFFLDNGEVIHFRDMRLFGRIQPADSKELWTLPVIQKLGLDPLVDGMTPSQLRQALGDTKQSIKVALMDQGRIAGLGNIHAAEALYRARIHPRRRPKSLSPEEWKRLCKAIHDTFRFALAREASEEIEYVEEPGSENPFLVYGRAGERCRRCRQGRIQSFVLGGRTSYFCPKCQLRRRAA
jgi:formamidopyrimidine-DNA glycosylase